MKFNSILLHMLICCFSEKAIASQCKAASYSVQDHVLINHVIKAGPAELIEHCISRCIKHPGCHSSNFYRKRGWCELNDKTHASHPEDMKQVPFTNYMANTLRPFTCITHPDCGSNLICSLSKCVGELVTVRHQVWVISWSKNYKWAVRCTVCLAGKFLARWSVEVSLLEERR